MGGFPISPRLLKYLPFLGQNRLANAAEIAPDDSKPNVLAVRPGARRTHGRSNMARAKEKCATLANVLDERTHMAAATRAAWRRRPLTPPD